MPLTQAPENLGGEVAAGLIGLLVERDAWVGVVAVLRVDVVKLAAALSQAAVAGLTTTVGPLGAAAVAGYDPAQVVKVARERGQRRSWEEPAAASANPRPETAILPASRPRRQANAGFLRISDESWRGRGTGIFA